MTEVLYDLVVFSDGDARVYRHDHWKGEGAFQVTGGAPTLTYNVVQTSPDKEFLIKIANMTRSDYINKYEILGEHERQALRNNVDQTMPKRKTR